MAEVGIPKARILRKRLALPDTLTRVVKYVLVRGIALLFSVIAGVYLTILIANMGWYLDQMRIAEIMVEVGMSVLGNPEVRRLPAS